MRFERESWRKLFRQEPLEQRAWPLVTRAVRDHLIRYPEELDGYLVRVPTDGGGQSGDIEGTVVSALCAALGTHAHERELVAAALRTLLNDGYLIVDSSGRVSIRNFEDAQRSKDAKKKAKQRARARGDNRGTSRGTTGGHDMGQSGDIGGDKSGTLARARGDETRREIEDPPTPFSPPKNQSKLRDPFMASLTGRRTQDDPGVIAVFESWKRAHGSVNSKFRQPADARADILFEAVTTHTVDACLRVIESSKSDGMVTGRTDEKGQKHTSIEYIFKPTTFDRLLRAADDAAKKKRSTGGLERAMVAEPDLSDYREDEI